MLLTNHLARSANCHQQRQVDKKTKHWRLVAGLSHQPVKQATASSLVRALHRSWQRLAVSYSICSHVLAMLCKLVHEAQYDIKATSLNKNQVLPSQSHWLARRRPLHSSAATRGMSLATKPGLARPARRERLPVPVAPRPYRQRLRHTEDNGPLASAPGQ